MTAINRMSHAEQLLLAGFGGAILAIILMVSISDLHASAPLKELQECKDKPDTTAYYARLPGESHTTEACLHAIRFGSPNWVPDFRSPLPPEKGK